MHSIIIHLCIKQVKWKHLDNSWRVAISCIREYPLVLVVSIHAYRMATQARLAAVNNGAHHRDHHQ